MRKSGDEFIQAIKHTIIEWIKLRDDASYVKKICSLCILAEKKSMYYGKECDICPVKLSGNLTCSVDNSIFSKWRKHRELCEFGTNYYVDIKDMLDICQTRKGGCDTCLKHINKIIDGLNSILPKNKRIKI
jgi:hypothetical protein